MTVTFSMLWAKATIPSWASANFRSYLPAYFSLKFWIVQYTIFSATSEFKLYIDFKRFRISLIVCSITLVAYIMLRILIGSSINVRRTSESLPQLRSSRILGNDGMADHKILPAPREQWWYVFSSVITGSANGANFKKENSLFLHQRWSSWHEKHPPVCSISETTIKQNFLRNWTGKLLKILFAKISWRFYYLFRNCYMFWSVVMYLWKWFPLMHTEQSEFQVYTI